MTRLLPALLLLAACSTATPPPPTVDPVTDPTIVGAVDEAVLQGSIEAEAAARTGRRIGRVAGVVAAVFGGPETETVNETIDRYRRTRDAVETTAAVIGATNGAVEGARRGYDFDLQFAALQQIEGLDVIRPYPDEIQVRFVEVPTQQTLADLAAVLATHQERALDIEAPGDTAFAIRASLIDLGVKPSTLEAHADGDLEGIVLRIRYPI